MSVSKQIRTTISLPAASLSAAKRAAKARRVKLSTVVAEALEESLKQQSGQGPRQGCVRTLSASLCGFQ